VRSSAQCGRRSVGSRMLERKRRAPSLCSETLTPARAQARAELVRASPRSPRKENTPGTRRTTSPNATKAGAFLAPAFVLSQASRRLALSCLATRDALKSLSGHVRGPCRADWIVPCTRTKPFYAPPAVESMPVLGATLQAASGLRIRASSCVGGAPHCIGPTASMGVQFAYGQGGTNSASHHLGSDSGPRCSCLLEVSGTRPRGLAKEPCELRQTAFLRRE